MKVNITISVDVEVLQELKALQVQNISGMINDYLLDYLSLQPKKTIFTNEYDDEVRDNMLKDVELQAKIADRALKDEEFRKRIKKKFTKLDKKNEKG